MNPQYKPDFLKDSQPQFLYEDVGSCKILFTWETAAACPMNEQADVETDCTVKNSVTGKLFIFHSHLTFVHV